MGLETNGDDDFVSDIDYILPDTSNVPEEPLEDSRVLRKRPNWDVEIMRSMAQIFSLPKNGNLKDHLRGFLSSQVAMLLHRIILEKHPFTGIHQQNVADIAGLLAKRLRLLPDQIDVIHSGALVHDVGKMAIPFRLLDKKKPPTEEEINLLHEHPTEGYDFAYALGFNDLIRDIILHHHEKEDGTGYPSGTFDISLPAKIVSLVDGICAQAENRPDGKPKNGDEIIQSLAITQSQAVNCEKNDPWPMAIQLCIDLINNGDLLKRIRKS